MANTDIALRRIITPNVASGIRLLRGLVFRIFCSAAAAIPGSRRLFTWARGGIEVIGFWSSPSGSGGFMGSTLSGICYRSITGRQPWSFTVEGVTKELFCSSGSGPKAPEGRDICLGPGYKPRVPWQNDTDPPVGTTQAPTHAGPGTGGIRPP